MSYKIQHAFNIFFPYTFFCQHFGEITFLFGKKMRKWRGRGKGLMICTFFLFIVYSSSLSKAVCAGELVIKTGGKNYNLNGMGEDGELVRIIYPHTFW